MVKVLLIDDHDMVRNALAKMLAANSDIEIVGGVENAEKGWELLRTQPADVIVSDLDLPGESGRQFALKVLEQDPSQGVIILSYRVEPSEVQFLVEAGVRGYVPKSAPAEELIQAVRAVAQGHHHFAPQAATALAESVRNRNGDKLNPLSLRQTLILQQMARGKTTKEIADQMCLSPKTVEKYRSEILRRLNCKNQVQALEVGRRLQLLQDDSGSL
ncbi:response regulator transcription factor [bacterium]|nr:response regulator transcription factor [bacterium]